MNNIHKNLQEIMQVVESKRKKYGKGVDIAVTDMLTTLYPDGIAQNEYDDAIFLIRICEKLGRITSKNIDPKAKNDAYNDIVGYGLLGLNKDEEEKA